jgi:hypothetical protein
MSGSALALQLKLLVAAIVVVPIDLMAEGSIGEVGAACPAAIADSLPTASIKTPRRPQEPAAGLQSPAQAARPISFLERRSDPPADDPSASAPAPQPPAIAPSVSTSSHEGMPRPNRVNAIPGPAPRPAPPVASKAEAAADATLVQQRDPNAAILNMAILADTYDETRMSPMWPGATPSPALPRLAMLLGAGGSVAIGILGLVALELIRRRRRTCAPSPARFADHGRSRQTDLRAAAHE